MQIIIIIIILIKRQRANGKRNSVKIYFGQVMVTIIPTIIILVLLSCILGWYTHKARSNIKCIRTRCVSGGTLGAFFFNTPLSDILTGLERVAEELMGRKKWSLYQSTQSLPHGEIKHEIPLEDTEETSSHSYQGLDTEKQSTGACVLQLLIIIPWELHFLC